MRKEKVFLGGTCNGSTWRNELIPMLEIDYFNPFVEDWTPECQAEEIKQREECDYCLYVITPKQTGFYSMFEIADDSNKRPHKTIFCFLTLDDGVEFTSHQVKSLIQAQNLVENNGGSCFKSLEEIANYLNN